MPQTAVQAERALFPWRPWDLILAIIGAVGAIALIVLALAVAAPPVLSNLSSEVSDGKTTIAIGDGQAAVVVPAGWVVQRSGDVVTAITPDGALSTRLDLATGDPRTIVENVLRGAYGTLREETLASGLPIVHADASAHLLGAAVPIDGDTVVRVLAETSEEHDLAGYRAALADLLDGVRPGGGSS